MLSLHIATYCHYILPLAALAAIVIYIAYYYILFIFYYYIIIPKIIFFEITAMAFILKKKVFHRFWFDKKNYLEI